MTQHKMLTNKSQRSLTLYNIVFPVWVLPFVPILIIPFFFLNLAIDAAVIGLFLKWGNRKDNALSSENRVDGDASAETSRRDSLWMYVFKAALFGYAADFIGAGLLILLSAWTKGLVDYYTIWVSPISVILHLFAVALAGTLIFTYHSRQGKRLGLNAVSRRKLAWVMASVTAPWFYLVPMSLFYR